RHALGASRPRRSSPGNQRPLPPRSSRRSLSVNAKELFDGFRRPAPRPLSMMTAYDSTFAAIVAESGVDVLLVGDSLANTMLGMGKTAQVGMEAMLHHAKAVRRGAPASCILVDIPFGAD